MERKQRLTSSTDFKRVRRTGKSYAHPLAILITSRREGEPSRFGVATARGIVGAVRRNRAKRRLRETLRSLLAEIQPGWDVVVIARPMSLGAEVAELREAIAELLRRAQLLK